MSYLHSNISVHGALVFYEDLMVGVVFTLWAIDWMVEKVKLYRERKNRCRSTPTG
jgi:hypothetical protein